MSSPPPNATKVTERAEALPERGPYHAFELLELESDDTTARAARREQGH